MPPQAGSVADFAGAIEQIPPVSAFAAANDPNASDEGLYVVQSVVEDARAAAISGRGASGPDGKPARRTRPSRFLVDPSARLAFDKVLAPNFKVNVYTFAGSSFFEQRTLPIPTAFGARTGALNGGVSATADLGVANTNLTYEHSQPYKDFFTRRGFTGDGVAVTANKTLPFFIPNLVVNPSVSIKNAVANPMTGLTDSATLNLGFSYKLAKDLEISIAPNYGWTFNTELPGYRRTNGYGTVAGITYKPIGALILSAAVATGFSANFGVPPSDKRRNLNANPTLKAQYAVTSMLSLAIQAGYTRTWSNAKPASAYKYTVQPSVAVSIPL